MTGAEAGPAGVVLTMAVEGHGELVRRLHRTLSAVHPDLRLVVLDLGGDEPLAVEGVERLTPVDLPLGAPELRRRAAFSAPLELAAALVPELLAWALDGGAGTAVYVDPALELAAGESLAAVLDVATRQGVALVASGPPGEGHLPDDPARVGRGAIAPGLVAVGTAGRPFVDWWRRRAARDAILDPGRGLVLDRDVLEGAMVWFGAALVDPPAGGVPRTDPERAGTWPWARSAGGLTIDGGQRVRYRAELLAADEAFEPSPERRGDAPPDLFDPTDPDAHQRWLTEVVGGTLQFPRPRWADILWHQRVDLQVHFPEPDGDSAEGLHRWVAEHAQPPELVDRGVVLEEGPAPSDPEPVPGVNVVGFLDLDRGVGQAARMALRAVRAAGFPGHPLELPNPGAPPGRRALDVPAGPHDVNLLCVNPNEVVLLARSAAHRRVLRRSRNVALWFWEVDRLPDFMLPALDEVDEVWVASRYNADLFSGLTDAPVRVFPCVVDPPVAGAVTRADLGLPDGFTFGFFFDHLSVFERKNPLGLLDAWRRAFAPGEGPHLVLKTLDGDQRPAERDQLRAAVAEHPDVTLIERHLTGVEMQALYAHVDAYVSLHRSEGFGLTMASAMAAGKPVIATGFSGNLDFMHADNGYLVGWTPVAVGEGSYPYPPEATWAEPDLDQAARWLRHVVEDPADAAAKGARARRDITSRYNRTTAGAFVSRALGGCW